MPNHRNRRDFLKESALAALGGALAASTAGETASAAPAGQPAIALPPESHMGLPSGKLGNLQVTRLFLGCNQVSGYSHSRDLSYVSHLMSAYQTDDRVLNTWPPSSL